MTTDFAGDPHLPSSRVERMRSFDGQTVSRATVVRPDRYRQLGSTGGSGGRIARGGGYSYVAASFAEGAHVLEMTRFDRVLGLDADARTCRAEAGASLERLFGVAASRESWIAIQPGYPLITLGGCIASNVNAKNSGWDGTFVDVIERLTLHHPAHGELDVNRGTELFDLTCGGYGLTGTIVDATVRLSRLPGSSVVVRRLPVGSMVEAVALLDPTVDEPFAYSWHDPATTAGRFGRGVVQRAGWSGNAGRPDVPRYLTLTSRTRALLPIPLWRPVTISAVNEVLWRIETSKPKERVEALFRFLFPFAFVPHYFLAFGRHGFFEAQLLIPHAEAHGFLGELTRQVLAIRPPITLLSLKFLRGRRRLLRFAGDGVCVSLDLAASPESIRFLEVLDAMVVSAGGLPNVIKDSRLPLDVVRRCYPDYDEFRSSLRAFDPARLFRSHLAERLDL